MYQGIRISGFGGQGVISAGVLLAQAGIWRSNARISSTTSGVMSRTTPPMRG